MMSELVPWEPSDYKHLFKDREQMQHSLGVSRLTLGQWILRELIGFKQKIYLDGLLITHDQKIFLNSKVGQKYNIDPLYLEQRSVRLKKKWGEKKTQISKEIKNGATFESLAESLGLAKASVYKVLHKCFKSSSIDIIRQRLERA